MRTEIDVPNPGGRLYPGMYAQVSLETELHQNAMTLPVSSVGTDPNGKFVYVVQQGRIVRQPIQIGMTEGGMVEVLSGVATMRRNHDRARRTTSWHGGESRSPHLDKAG